MSAPKPNTLPLPTEEPAKAAPASSRGERWFDWGVYGGINYLGTFFLTVPVADWIQHGGGKALYERAGESLVKLGVNARYARQALHATALMFGGTLMLAPVWAFEKFHTPIVNWINEKYGTVQDRAARPQDAPEQTWGSLLMGRISAWTAVFASFAATAKLFPQTRQAFEHEYAKNLLCKPFGHPTHIDGVETKAYRIGKIAALDTFATAAATILLYMSSRFFARRREQRAQDKADNPAPAPESADAGLALQQRAPGDRPTSRLSEKPQHAGTLQPATLATQIS